MSRVIILVPRSTSGRSKIILMITIIHSEGVSINFSSVSISFVSCSTGHPWRSVGNEGDVQLLYWTLITRSSKSVNWVVHGPRHRGCWHEDSFHSFILL